MAQRFFEGGHVCSPYCGKQSSNNAMRCKCSPSCPRNEAKSKKRGKGVEKLTKILDEYYL